MIFDKRYFYADIVLIMKISPHTVIKKSFLRSIFLIFLLILSNTYITSQTKQNTVKAVFLERFTRFIEWPQNDTFQDIAIPFMIGVVGDEDFFTLLESMYSKIKIKNKPVQIMYIHELDDIGKCNLVYIADIDKFSLNNILNQVADQAILTISNHDGYAEKGVLINFYIQDQRIRFEINENALKKSGLYMSHLLLKEAKIVQPTRGNR